MLSSSLSARGTLWISNLTSFPPFVNGVVKIHGSEVSEASTSPGLGCPLDLKIWGLPRPAVVPSNATSLASGSPPAGPR